MAFLTTQRLEELILIMGPVAPWGDKYTEIEPREIAMRQRTDRRLREMRESRKRDREVSVFLSYSHYDKKWAHAVSLFLEMIDGDLYIDLRDSDLPRDASEATANILRDRIARANKFLVLVTDKTKESVWVPWELGLADGMKGTDNIAILPLSTARGFEGQEYLAKYNRVENSGSDMLTLYDANSKTAQVFSHWLHGITWSRFRTE